MLHDLSGAGTREEHAGFVVIGGGTVGLPLAVGLARRSGRRVICLESGGRQQEGETHPLNRVVQHAAHYGGAEHGRFRCLGGTSTRWGGALIPFQDADLAGWPLAMDDLAPFIPEVEQLFGLEDGPYHDLNFPADLSPEWTDRLAKWPEFARRNVAALMGETAAHAANLDIWLNATVTEIKLGRDAVRVTARTFAGDSIDVTADRIIVAAGAIETTRLALLIDQQNGGRIAAACPALGRYFADHVSVPVGRLKVRNATALNRVIGFRFGERGAMRNLRFELAPGASARASVPPCFVHVVFDPGRKGPFAAMRDIYRRLQMRRAPTPGAVAQLALGLPWLARAAWWRFVRRRLLFPAGADLQVHVIMEQEALAKNRITLDQSERDAFGQPLASIDWRVSARDADHATAAARLFAEAWNSSKLADVATVELFPTGDVRAAMASSEGIFHPTGSTRMGANATEGVVNADLKLFVDPRIQLLATSVLQTGGGANPTMMLLLLAMRCVAQHAEAAGRTYD